MTHAIDLTQEQRNMLSALLRRFLPGVAVWAYGSRVKWTARPNSDLDLVAFTTPAQRVQVSDLKDALAESNLPFPVDLHVWDEVPERFREIIRKEYVVVQETKQPDSRTGMAGEWNAAPLSVLAELSGGFAFKSADYAPSGRFILRTLNISDDCSINRDDAVYLPEELCPQYSRFELKAQDTLFVMVGATLGKVGFVREKDLPALLNQNMWLIRANPERADSRFVHYAFRHSVKESLGWASGSARDFVRRDDYRNLMIPSPSLMEQRAIAHILGTLDDKIELNRRMNETLEAMARALFKSWFVDFDPVRAKAEGRDPGLPKSLADLFPDSFEDSALGEIPKGWRLAPLPDVIDVNPTRALRKGIEAPYLDMANMPTQGHSPDEVVARAFGSGMRFANGDTLIARITPCLENGKTAFVDFLESGGVGWGSTEYIVLRPKPPLPDEFAYCLARSNEFRDFAIQRMTGSSGRQRVPAESLSHFRVVVAPKSVAECFGQLIKPLFARSRAANKEGRTLAALRDTLLPKLISGEVRVKDAERFMERAG